MPTQQETFDTVVRALRKQGRKSGEGTNCFYRGPEGTKCAAGHLISDKDYRPDMEGYAAYTASIAAALEGHDESLVRNLQIAHDGANTADFLHYFLSHAKRIAASFDLDPACITEDLT